MGERLALVGTTRHPRRAPVERGLTPTTRAHMNQPEKSTRHLPEVEVDTALRMPARLRLSYRLTSAHVNPVAEECDGTFLVLRFCVF